MGQIDLDGSNSTLKADVIRGQASTTVKLGGLLDTDGNYIQTEKGGDITSASPLVIDTDGDYFDVTGTVSFAAMTVAADRQFTLQFDGILTMTHHATNLDLPGEANITTAAGDVATFQSTGSNTVQCINYTRADGTPIVSSSHTPEGTAVLSTGEAGGTKYLREDGDGTSSWQTAGGGKVLQVVEGTHATEAASSSSTYADTGLTVNITPSNTSNKVLVIVNMGTVGKDTADTTLGLKLLRGATNISEHTNIAKDGGTGDNYTATGAFHKLDSPSTTSATTYKVQYKSSASAASARVMVGNSNASIVCMEIDGT